MEFRVLSPDADINHYPGGYVYLIEDIELEEHPYQTQSQAYYKDSAGEITLIGAVKIGE